MLWWCMERCVGRGWRVEMRRWCDEVATAVVAGQQGAQMGGVANELYADFLGKYWGGMVDFLMNGAWDVVGVGK